MKQYKSDIRSAIGRFLAAPQAFLFLVALGMTATSLSPAFPASSRPDLILSSAEIRSYEIMLRFGREDVSRYCLEIAFVRDGRAGKARLDCESRAQCREMNDEYSAGVRAGWRLRIREFQGRTIARLEPPQEKP